MISRHIVTYPNLWRITQMHPKLVLLSRLAKINFPTKDSGFLSILHTPFWIITFGIIPSSFLPIFYTPEKKEKPSSFTSSISDWPVVGASNPRIFKKKLGASPIIYPVFFEAEQIGFLRKFHDFSSWRWSKWVKMISEASSSWGGLVKKLLKIHLGNTRPSCSIIAFIKVTWTVLSWDTYRIGGPGFDSSYPLGPGNLLLSPKQEEIFKTKWSNMEAPWLM